MSEDRYTRATNFDKKIFGVVDYSYKNSISLETVWDYSLELEVTQTNAPKEKLLEAITLLCEEFKTVYGLEDSS